MDITIRKHTHKKQYFSHFAEVSFIGGGNKHAAIHRQTLSHNVVSSTPRHELDSNSQLDLARDK